MMPGKEEMYTMAARELYEKQQWLNKPVKTSPVSSSRLSHIENGVEEAANKRALKEIYDDEAVSLGRKEGTKTGYNSIAAGTNVEATGEHTQSFGIWSAASGFCASARNSATASGTYADASGSGTTASGTASRTGGIGTVASADAADAGGIQTAASSQGACSRGYKTKASGPFSMAEGYCTEAGGQHQHVQGRYNVVDTESLYADIVGGGTSGEDRKNIYTLDWQGNARFAGDVTNGNGVSVDSLKAELDAVPGLREIQAWCTSMFQPKGEYLTSTELDRRGYLTSVPEGYVTAAMLDQKGYLTTVPVATDRNAGGVKPDGTTIIMDDDGTIHAVGGGGGQGGALTVTADQTVAVPFTLVDEDDVTEEELEWNQEL